MMKVAAELQIEMKLKAFRSRELQNKLSHSSDLDTTSDTYQVPLLLCFFVLNMGKETMNKSRHENAILDRTSVKSIAVMFSH
jgi:hypothetical protein